MIAVTQVLSVLDFAYISTNSASEASSSSVETAKIVLRGRLAIQSILVAPSLGMFFTYQTIYGCMILFTYLIVK